MSCKIQLCVVLWYFISIIHDSESSCKYVPNKPLPYPTLAPINVDTKLAEVVNTSTPLTVRNTLFSPLLLKNTGYALEIYGNPYAPDSAGIYGGVLCDFYKFHELRFYVNSDLKGRSDISIDGVSTPLTLSLIYYKYPTFKESLQHRDGLVVVDMQLTFSPFTNILFTPVDFLIRLLREPGAALYAPASLLYAWSDIIPETNHYYAFPGSYQDQETGKIYQCSTNIVAPSQYARLTKTQFEAFLSLKSQNGSNLETVAPMLNPIGRRKILKAYGVVGQYVPF